MEHPSGSHDRAGRPLPSVFGDVRIRNPCVPLENGDEPFSDHSRPVGAQGETRALTATQGHVFIRQPPMTQNRHPSVDRLLAAIRKSGEFPAMAKTVGLISSLTSSEATSSGALADTILQDYGLTQKVLRLVNTVAYAQYDEITTVTRAVPVSYTHLTLPTNREV